MTSGRGRRLVGSICDADRPPCVTLTDDDSSLDPEAIIQVPIRFKR